MELVLQISTILGGIAALWFFWEKLSPNWKHKDSMDSHIQANVSTITTSQDSWDESAQRKLATVFCAVAGISSGVVAGLFGALGIFTLPFLGIIVGFIAFRLGDSGDIIGAPLYDGAVFIFIWGLLSELIFIFVFAFRDSDAVSFIAAFILSIIGGAAGALFGFKRARVIK